MRGFSADRKLKENCNVGRFWTSHWRYHHWRPDINPEGKRLRSSASDSFRKRGVAIGDTIYVISLNDGHLYLGGRFAVKRIIARREAVKLLKSTNLYDAKEWAVDPERRSGTPLHLHRRLSPKLTKRLRFATKSGPKAPFFVSDSALDNQATRGVRELTAESAALLDQIIDRTDQLPKTGALVTVTDSMLRATRDITSAPPATELEFLPAPPTSMAADLQPPLPGRASTTVNRIIRDTELAQLVTRLHAYKCQICGHTIELVDGCLYAEAHHIRPLGHPHDGPDVIGNILCVCPNHHAELDLRARTLTLSDLRLANGHVVEQKYINYHNRKICR